ncbi:hypothetical protein RHECNPAF_6420067 [Rhizobium etli CNPAF512]|nr:hypothetical protein RHECNPAF_6420067 [Rhizobium etli CNPAF512]
MKRMAEGLLFRHFCLTTVTRSKRQKP